ncbi:hypothetical protein ARALYDRAFT_359729 [Arabidopsis lyrata subsp. lyrata]|uniref:Uncharacterized protein n=1 Tax=Arabidopsis lyrata subsp. lyrata TaxID=81972 RepID=D7MY63_ARALL|nr:hypothetical protein ARALYDRAFT_359729 [Arabidopsis lyrata subsp. lyrata]
MASFVSSTEVIVPEEETRSLEEEVIKLMKLMNLESLGNRESRLTGLEDDGNLKTESRFQEALQEESSSSSVKWGFAEAKDEVVSLGIRLTHALIKLTLLRVHKNEREKQLWLRNWIFGESYKKQSALMYLLDYLLDKSGWRAEQVLG